LLLETKIVAINSLNISKKKYSQFKQKKWLSRELALEIEDSPHASDEVTDPSSDGAIQRYHSQKTPPDGGNQIPW